MEFTRLDGSVFDYYFFPSHLFEGYSNFLIFQYGDYPAAVLILFNGNNLNISTGSNSLIVDSNGQPLQQYFYSRDYGSLYDAGTLSEVSIGLSYSLSVLSDNLKPYSNELLSGNASIVLPEKQESVFTLRPIIESQTESYSNVFSDIFGVLPVLLVVLISFIGIRKGISWLFSFLKRS